MWTPSHVQTPAINLLHSLWPQQLFTPTPLRSHAARSAPSWSLTVTATILSHTLAAKAAVAPFPTSANGSGSGVSATVAQAHRRPANCRMDITSRPSRATGGATWYRTTISIHLPDTAGRTRKAPTRMRRISLTVAGTRRCWISRLSCWTGLEGGTCRTLLSRHYCWQLLTRWRLGMLLRDCDFFLWFCGRTVEQR